MTSIALAGCGGIAPGEPPASLTSERHALATDLDGNTVEPDVSGRVCKHVTVKGKMMYNDQRTYGRFQIRKGNAGWGVQYKKASGPLYNDGRPDDLLGLLDGSVSIYEIDGSASGPGCSESELAGSTTIAADGSWTWSGEVCDDCAADDLSETSASSHKLGVSLGVKVSLSHCPADRSRCFAIENPGAFISPAPDFDDHGVGATTYAVWMSAAGLASPSHAYTDGAVLDVGQGTFQTKAHDPTDLWGQAANVFASIVDATRAVHTEGGISFKYDQYGSVDVIFPSNFDYSASHSHESGQICIVGPGSVITKSNGDHQVLGAYATTWLAGDTPMHEYGHIVNYRAWDGHGKWVDYSYSGNDGEQDPVEFDAAAFKENFADFIKRVTMNDVDDTITDDRKGCASFDDDVSGALATCSVGYPCTNANRSPDVVEHVLCDLYDTGPDGSDPDVSWRHDDLFDGDLQTVIDALKAAWNDDASARTAYINASNNHGLAVKDSGLRICALPTAWAKTHPTRVTALDETLLHNGLDCGLPPQSVGSRLDLSTTLTFVP